MHSSRMRTAPRNRTCGEGEVSLTETPLDRDLLDRDPLWTETPSRTETPLQPSVPYESPLHLCTLLQAHSKFHPITIL